MDKPARARMIIDTVLGSDRQFGRAGPPRSEMTTENCRMISGDCRWEARLSKKYYKDSSGRLWDMIELTAHGEHRMTVVFDEEDLMVRMYLPGPWEKIFTVIDPLDTDKLLPN